MRENRKARPGVAAPGRAKMEAGTGQATTSMIDFNTNSTPGQAVRMADFLSHGPENGITLRHLEKLTNLPGREVRRQIERERRSGALILSDNQHGYFLAADPVEAQRFARSMLNRAEEIRKTARAVEAAAERMAD